MWGKREARKTWTTWRKSQNSEKQIRRFDKRNVRFCQNSEGRRQKKNLKREWDKNKILRKKKSYNSGKQMSTFRRQVIQSRLWKMRDLWGKVRNSLIYFGCFLQLISRLLSFSSNLFFLPDCALLWPLCLHPFFN